jgi:hypothetical protein
VPKWDDIQYVVDGKGRKKAVIMSYRAYQRLLEDLADLKCMEERKHEPSRPLESVIEDLRNVGRLE